MVKEEHAREATDASNSSGSFDAAMRKQWISTLSNAPQLWIATNNGGDNHVMDENMDASNKRDEIYNDGEWKAIDDSDRQ